MTDTQNQPELVAQARLALVMLARVRTDAIRMPDTPTITETLNALEASVIDLLAEVEKRTAVEGLTTDQRRSLMESAVDVLEPHLVNRTAAYNTWNTIASDERFVRAIVMFTSAGDPEHHAERFSPDHDCGAHSHWPCSAVTAARANRTTPYASTSTPWWAEGNTTGTEPVDGGVA